MVHKGRRQHFLRKRKEAAIVKTSDDARILDKVSNLIDQRAVLFEMNSSAEATRV
jgi:hypothetical protein